MKKNRKKIITIFFIALCMILLAVFYKNTVKAFYFPNQTRTYYRKIAKDNIEGTIRVGNKNNKPLKLVIKVFDEKGKELAPTIKPEKNGNEYIFQNLRAGMTYKIVTRNPKNSFLTVWGLYIVDDNGGVL
ncbi:hypothetical protein [Lactococcus protaetiae]|uniref:Uncharacterized protein n=1 Tax=Lactococcus protaetiae TaxID=2592653 RepID=A0A514Z807_9LACT|nr:hypothetical protein [Lactococcus protaetiae]QDK70731.1 hypothetical protein FLP15_05650 [Lactococcus protaetiae]